MRRILLAITALLMLASCATYTISDGYASIVLPEESDEKIETRYRLIKAEAQEEIIFTVPDPAEAAVPTVPPAEMISEDEAIVEPEDIEQISSEQEEETESSPTEETVEPTVEGSPEDIPADTTPVEEQPAVEATPEPAAEEADPVTIEETETSVTRDINEYPVNLRDITYPHVYTPVYANELKTGQITTVRVLMLDLGYRALGEESISRIIASVEDTDPDFIILTGSLSNQVDGAEAAGIDAVTLRGGTILYSSRLDRVNNGESAVFTVAEGKNLGIAPVSFRNAMPATAGEIEGWLSAISATEEETAAEVVDIAEGITDSERILALSSPSPATADWMELTPYSYRTAEKFAISDRLAEEGWTDAFATTHFSPETDGGITKISGDIYERLDFLYIKGMMPDYSLTFPVAGLTDTIGNLGLIAEFIIP